MKKILSESFWADQDIEQLIGKLLRYGVVTASTIVLIGGILLLIQHGQGQVPSYHRFAGESDSYTTFKGIVSGAISLQAKGIIQLGVIVLIATPIMRIAFSLVGFILEKDKMYILITLIVLCVMLFSTIGGLKI
ncbi:DUF1634 domain-containing protein [Mucilaginibacter sp. RS28]|uniref:DUF1634 domain-containing protein n=1 Tax=Mucilaginibacter straminoryzae TaxID=2932774 RepID=A0A9X1X1P5_9SPHI|nr:DUF1634 domain-containing protein [Mucilaginibacter straminoryzae]MCJ8209216.1 DUF1634 domain-containing protein [Mucilaginibacter straminoryzae]